jgi:crotonobetainyl-CoA:carnitine CoA-transferase CaiB-like acyl-CoA transferase
LASAFAGVTVLEYADFIAGPYCARLLADLGARVIKIEAPGRGDSARRYGPFPGDVPDPEKSGLFLFLNTNKRSITLDPALPTGQELLTRLLSRADVLVEDTQPGTMKRLGLDYPTLQQVNPRLVYVSITPYGQDGPKALWKAYHINSFHASGEGYTLPGGEGHAMFPQRAPITAGVHLGEYDAGLLAASATVAALYAREIWGTGQHVDLSKQEATLSLNRLTYAQFLGQSIAADRSRRYEYGGIYPCRDGYVVLYPREDRHWKALVEIMGKTELAQDQRFCTRAARIQHGEEVNRLLLEWTSTLSKAEIYHQVAPSGCPAAFFATPEEVVQSPQLEARQFFVEIDHPKVGLLKYPSRPYRSSAIPWQVEMPAPLLGQHNEELFCGELGLTHEELADLRRGGVV